MIEQTTLQTIKVLTEINSLTADTVQLYWLQLLGEINNYNDEIQYNQDEINDTPLLKAALAEYIIVTKNNLWGDTLEYHKDKLERYINTLTGLGV